MKGLGVLVLAAGLSRRMGGPNKLLMSWRGKPLVAHALDLADSVADVCKLIVVHRDEVEVSALLAQRAGWRSITNNDTKSGLASSLQLGLIDLKECAWVLVLLGDMPDVSDSTLNRLIAACDSDAYAVVPTYDGQWGNPVLLQRAAIDDCAKLVRDQGARQLLLANKHNVRAVGVDDPAILRDFDVMADFAAKPCAPN